MHEFYHYDESIGNYQANHMKNTLPPNRTANAVIPILSVCILLAGCVEQGSSVTAKTEPPANVGQLSDAPSTDNSYTETVIEPPPEERSTDPEVPPTAWELIKQADISDQTRNANLIGAATILLTHNQISQAMSVSDLIAVDGLTGSERAELDILRARIHQLNDRHEAAFRILGKSRANPALSPEQRLRVTRLRAFSASHLDSEFLLISELVPLYTMLPSGSERLAVGHQLWNILSRLSSEDIANALADSDLTDARPWIVLALNINLVRHDPQLIRDAVDSWVSNHPDHPAVQLVRAGIAADAPDYAKISVLIPLSSQSRLASQAFRDGMSAQYHADTTANKPVLEFVDIGNDPTQVTQFYYESLLNGADFVVGPLGIGFVNEMVQFGDFVVPTLLLGAADGVATTDPVYQFALLPEHSGIAAARRARKDGHSTALLLESPSGWSQRATAAFREEWERLGGAVVQSRTFELDRNDYSDTIKEVFNIDQSVARYRSLGNLLARPLKFTPRRRHDADCIFLSSDIRHGRLIKPHIDFLKAHDVPVYSTHHIFSGEVDKIADQDLDGVRFTDMNWMIDRSDAMVNMRRKLSAKRSMPAGLNRIYAMGIDVYNLISRLNPLRGDPDMRYHGVTSTIQVDEAGRVLGKPTWAQFIDGIPEIDLRLPDPEGIDKTVNREPSLEVTDLER